MSPSSSRFKVASLIVPYFWARIFGYVLIVSLTMQFDPIGCVVLEFLCAVQDKLLQVVRYNEGYSMSTRKEIGCEMRICDPGGWRRESGCSHHESDADQEPPRETEG